MLRYSKLLLVLIVLITGCQSDKISTDKTKAGEASVLSENERNKKAMDHFINGNVADMKGDHAAAILEYQDALKLEKSAGVHYALSKDYLILNKLSLALDNAKQAIRLDSSNADYYYLLADIYTSARQMDSAAIAYEKIIRKDSSDVQALFFLASIYEHNKPTKALEIYKKIIETNGPDWNVLARVAEIYNRLGNTEEAVKSVEELSAIDPSNLDLQKLVVETYLKAKKYDPALKKVEELLQQFPDDLALIELKGQIYLQQENWAEAAKQFSLLLENPKINLDAKIRVGSIYFIQSVKDTTLLPTVKEMFTKLDKDTTDWQIKMFLGEIALREKKDTVAIRYFKQVTDLAKWNGEAYVRLGGLYFDNKKYMDAISLLEDAVMSFPDDFAINLILGLSLSQSNSFIEAEPYLQKSVELNPTDINALSALGYTLSRLNQNDEAIIYLNKALVLEPKNVDLLGTLGLIYNEQKKFKECDSIYSKALEIDSTNALVLNNYAYSLSERGIELQRALNMVSKAVEKDPKNPSYLDTIGWVYYQLGNYELAELNIRKAIDAEPDNSTIVEHLGDVLFKKGNKTEALSVWEKALKLNSDNHDLKNKIEKGEL